MNKDRQNSVEIIDIMESVVKATSAGCKIKRMGFDGNMEEIECPELSYVFGNSLYVKERLDELSKTVDGSSAKLPMIALFCPIIESREDPDCQASAKVRVLIAASSLQQWSNEERREYSFENVLRPIYNSFIEALIADDRLDFGYRDFVKHKYSENYSYGRYGALDSSGEAVSEPIDAINITDLELKINKKTCR